MAHLLRLSLATLTFLVSLTRRPSNELLLSVGLGAHRILITIG